mmetsp:Transcript_3303/g.3843  ORF Transcript_3303/g.3843 Transcript_3303/m.3843 type:complete len:145 (+) Transcript_3303:87-521(+)
MMSSKLSTKHEEDKDKFMHFDKDEDDDIINSFFAERIRKNTRSSRIFSGTSNSFNKIDQACLPTEDVKQKSVVDKISKSIVSTMETPAVKNAVDVGSKKIMKLDELTANAIENAGNRFSIFGGSSRAKYGSLSMQESDEEDELN